MPDYVKVFTIKGGDGQERRMELPLQLDVDRPKRPRTTFHADQLQALEMAFQTDGYPNAEKRTRLAKELRLSDTQVKVWFQNRRTKGRKQGGGLEKAKDSPKPPETSSKPAATWENTSVPAFPYMPTYLPYPWMNIQLPFTSSIPQFQCQ